MKPSVEIFDSNDGGILASIAQKYSSLVTFHDDQTLIEKRLSKLGPGGFFRLSDKHLDESQYLLVHQGDLEE